MTGDVAGLRALLLDSAGPPPAALADSLFATTFDPAADASTGAALVPDPAVFDGPDDPAPDGFPDGPADGDDHNADDHPDAAADPVPVDDQDLYTHDADPPVDDGGHDLGWAGGDGT